MEVLISDINLTYISPAWPLSNISLIKCYQLGKDENGIYIYNNGNKQYYEYELIKQMFIDKIKTWDEIEEENFYLIEEIN